MRDHFHLERMRSSRDLLADAAKADEAKGF
jgi:hypothetical protein